jgi:hypothetical protein
MYNKLKHKTNMTKTKVRIKETDQGGTIYNLLDHKEEGKDFAVTVVQDNKEAKLVGSLEDIINIIDPYPEKELRGHIVTKEFLKPYKEDDALMYLKIKNGKYCKKGDQYIWSISYHTHNINDTDDIIEEDN